MLTTEQIEALARLARTADQVRLGDAVLRRQVAAARAAGASWASVGRMLGCTKQAAAARFGAPTVRRQPVPEGGLLW